MRTWICEAHGGLWGDEIPLRMFVIKTKTMCGTVYHFGASKQFLEHLPELAPTFRVLSLTVVCWVFVVLRTGDCVQRTPSTETASSLL